MKQYVMYCAAAAALSGCSTSSPQYASSGVDYGGALAAAAIASQPTYAPPPMVDMRPQPVYTPPNNSFNQSVYGWMDRTRRY